MSIPIYYILPYLEIVMPEERTLYSRGAATVEPMNNGHSHFVQCSEVSLRFHETPLAFNVRLDSAK